MRRAPSTAGRSTLRHRMAAMRRGAGVGLALLAALVTLPVQGCGDGTKTLSETEATRLLRELPYRFKFAPVAVPDGAGGAVGGTAYGPHRTVVRFGVALGHGAEPVSLGPHTDLANATGGATFRVSSDMMEVIDGRLEIGRHVKTGAQWRTTANITVAIEEKLCWATEGQACPI